MKIVKYVSATLLVLIALAAGAAFLFISPEHIADRIAQTINQKTGYHITFQGQPKLNLFPTIGISFEGINVTTQKQTQTSNPQTNSDHNRYFMTAKKLRAEVELLPLITRKIEVREFVLDTPVFNLYVDENDNNNWTATNINNTTKNQTNTQNHDDDPQKWNISSAPMRLINGEIIYQNQKTKQKIYIHKINLSVSIQDNEKPSAISGLLTWNGGEISVEGQINDLHHIIKGDNPAKFRAALSLPDATIDIDGKIKTGNEQSIRAHTKIHINSVPKIIKWSGRTYQNTNIPQMIALEAQTNINKNEINIDNIIVNADQTTIKGKMSLKKQKQISIINATFNADHINLKPFLSQNKKNNTNKTKNENDQAELPKFENINANIELNADRASWNQFAIKNIKINTHIKNRQLKTKLINADVENGKINAEITINAKNDTPILNASANIKNLSAQHTLKNIYGVTWAHGNLNGKLNLNAKTKKWNQIIPNLNGNAQFNVKNASVKGINLAKIMRGIEKNIITGWQTETDQKTDFSNINAQFTIKNGIIHNQILNMTGPIITVNGKGTIHPQHKFIDYKLNPKITDNKNTTLLNDTPVIVKGPWNNPSIYPDIKGILENPTAIYDKIKNLKNLKTKDIKKDIIEKLTGDTKDIQKDIKKQGEQILKQLLGN